MNHELLKQALVKNLKHSYQKAKVKAKRFLQDAKRRELTDLDLDKLFQKGRNKLSAKRRRIQAMQDKNFKEYSAGRKARRKLSGDVQDTLENQFLDRRDALQRKLNKLDEIRYDMPDKLKAFKERQNTRSRKAKSIIRKAKIGTAGVAGVGTAGAVYLAKKDRKK